MTGPDDLPSSSSAPGPPKNQGLPELAPDIIEQEAGDQFDNLVPTRGYTEKRVVGLGGSAGGQAALEAFFRAMPPDSGMAFVVIMHLSPEHESILAQVIQRWTAMPVAQVQGTTEIEPDHVYVIPPAKNLSMEDGKLVLSNPARRPRGKHVAVDLFFRTLADTHGPHSAAIVLSGGDGDGAIGIKRIKERGGLTITQDPTQAEQDSMPRASIATGMVDWVLPAADMPGKLLDYWRTGSRLQLPVEEAEPPAPGETHSAPGRSLTPRVEATLHGILSFLQVRTGHNFSYYKRATVLRRIARRMQVNGIEDPAAYLVFIRTHPGEPTALLQDLLISVTNFFRDRDAFAALEANVPALFRHKGSKDTVRVWVAACATGEEAYSVAMLLCEYAATLEHPPKLQVFATDLDDGAITAARTAVYPETISADVSTERLRRFFTRGHGEYVVKREVREIVLFALHDLLKDSPFSRVDLVTCRNLLIYLNRDAQARALEIFHFALQPEGKLFLGSSESVDEGNPLFAALDKKWRLYVRRAGRRVGVTLSPGPSTVKRAMLNRPPSHLFPAPSAPAARELLAPSSWGELHDEFIRRLAPPSVIVNDDHDVLHVSDGAGRYLKVSGGEPTTKLLRMVHPMLRLELRAALYRAGQSGCTVETHGVPLGIDGERRAVTLRVSPVPTADATFLLVSFQEDAEVIAAGAGVVTTGAEPVVRQLEKELEEIRVRLRDTVEQADSTEEELKAANEELQAMNEELHSTAEELETGREELQSVNEELSTVNQELKSNVESLSHANSDLQNLMAATQIATVFLDRHLCIQRYTPPAVPLFRLIPTDVGRPLADLTPRLDYTSWTEDAERVLDQLSPIEVEVAHEDGRRFLARMLPYRTADDRIAGVVLTFVDITRRQQAEEEVRASEARFRAVADLVPDLLFSTDSTGNLLWCNERWVQYTGQPAALAQGFGWTETIHPEDRARVAREFLAAAERGEPYHGEHRLLRADGTACWFLVRAEPLRDAQGRILRWFGAKTEIEDFKRATASLAASEERLRLVIENAREYAIFSTDLELRVTSWNSGAEQILGYAETEILGRSSDLIFIPEDRAAGGPRQEARQALAEGRAGDERWHQRKDGSRFWASGAMMAMHASTGEAVGFVKILRDETTVREARLALEHSREELLAALKETEAARAEAEAAGRAKDHFLAVLSHELRTPLTPVMMAVHLLGRNRNLPGAARDALAMIQRNVQIESHLIDDLLDLTRITRGKLEVVREPTDLHQAVRHAVEICAADMQGKNQRLTVSLEATRHRLTGDATRLQQVFWNLLKNSSKFTPEGGSIRVATHDEPGRIIVEVSDTGIGFEPDAELRIFDAFSQADEEVTRKFGGLGLGLAISKATVDAHGGRLVARSAGRDQGAVFRVELPLATGE